MSREGRRLNGRAIAEAFVSPERKRLYAAPETLGQIFSFDMLFCDFSAEVFKGVIERQLQLSKQYKTGSIWVLSSHDVGLAVDVADDRSFVMRIDMAYLHTVSKTCSPFCFTIVNGSTPRANRWSWTGQEGSGGQERRA